MPAELNTQFQQYQKPQHLGIDARKSCKYFYIEKTKQPFYENEKHFKHRDGGYDSADIGSCCSGDGRRK